MVTFLYPHCSLSVAMILYQGTTFAAYRSIFHKELVYLPLTLTCLGVFSFGLPIASWWWVRTKHSATWTPNHIDMIFAPRGIWLPTHISYRYGFYFSEFDEAHKNFKTVVFVYFHGMALVTSLQFTTDIGCAIQLWACFLATFLMACAFLYLRPLRWTVANIGRAGTLMAQAAQLLSSAVGASDNEEATITLLLTGACVLEYILGAAITIREMLISAQLEQNGTEEQVNIVDLASVGVLVVQSAASEVSGQQMVERPLLDPKAREIQTDTPSRDRSHSSVMEMMPRANPLDNSFGGGRSRSQGDRLPSPKGPSLSPKGPPKLYLSKRELSML